MTKPADSGQIAKARAFINKKYPDGDFAQYTDPIEELIKDCAAFAASERQAVKEECAKVLENGANQWDADAKTAARNGDSAGGMIGITVASALRKMATAIRSME